MFVVMPSGIHICFIGMLAMKTIIIILIFLLLIGSFLFKKYTQISSLVPQPQRVRNENETIRKIIVFPHPTELQGPQDTAFRGVYRLLIDGLIKSDKSIPFPELTWDADSSWIKWAELEKRFRKR